MLRMWNGDAHTLMMEIEMVQPSLKTHRAYKPQNTSTCH